MPIIATTSSNNNHVYGERNRSDMDQASNASFSQKNNSRYAATINTQKEVTQIALSALDDRSVNAGLQTNHSIMSNDEFIVKNREAKQHSIASMKSTSVRKPKVENSDSKQLFQKPVSRNYENDANK